MIAAIVLAFGLAMDATAVAAARGLLHRRGELVALPLLFGAFQSGMAALGWLLGAWGGKYVAAFDHWIAFGLLSIVGVRMIRAGFDHEVTAWRGDPSRGWTLVMLSVATSIDALAVGLTLAMLGTAIWYPSVVIGLVAGGLSFMGIRLGSRLGRTFGKRMEIAGGALLLGIGLRILYLHLGG